jgi:hypothetical protein
MSQGTTAGHGCGHEARVDKAHGSLLLEEGKGGGTFTSWHPEPAGDSFNLIGEALKSSL